MTEKSDNAHVEDVPPEKVDFVIEEAKEATKDEHEMSLLRAVKLYPKAVGWSLLLSTALVMEGYDTMVS
jgi:SP family general alpha glucoside:H+ symporter-like MFS transporter